ncbi:MAG: hypothetical protein WHT06_15370 [Desulfobacterales bacterium]
MDILYLSPEFPPNYAQFVRSLHAEGVRVWAIGEADFYSLPPDLRSSIRWYARAELGRWERVEAAVGELLEIKHAQGFEGAFDWVESHNEAWLRLEAWINERFDIPGIRRDDIAPLKKKSVMKRLFQDARLPVARGAVVATLEEALQLARTLGYPVCLKPNEGVGARGVHRADDEAALREIFPRFTEDPLLEDWISAPIVTFDGLVDLEGEVVFENRLVYGEGVFEYTGGRRDPFFYVSREVPAGLAAAGRELLRRIGLRRKFFHFEFFERETDWVPIELNARPPGGAILDMMNYSIDGDLYRAWARILLRRPPALPAGKKYAVGYVGRRDRPYALPHDRLLELLGGRLVEYAENPPLFWEVMGRYRYIFRAEDEGEIRSLAAEARREGGSPWPRTS